MTKYLRFFMFVFCALIFSACAKKISQVKGFKSETSQSESVLLVLAHPDDETMMGALLVKLREMHIPVNALYVTSGEGGKHFSKPEIVGEKLGDARLKELTLAAQCLGFSSHEVLNYHDIPFRDAQGLPIRDGHAFLKTQSWDQGKLKNDIRAYVNRLQPSWIITMSLDKNTHAHHKAVRILTEELLKENQLPSVKAALSIKEWWWVHGSIEDETLSRWLEFSTSTVSPMAHTPYAKLASICAADHESQTEGHTGPLWGQEKLSFFYSQETLPKSMWGIPVLANL